MVKRNIPAAGVAVYLVLFWLGVFGLFVLMTRNTAPTAPEVAWSEEPLTTSTRLLVEITRESTDADGDRISYFYQWFLDGEPDDHVGRSWTAKETRKGQVYEVRVIPDDGTLGNWGCRLPWRECAGETFATLRGEIVNTPPRARVQFVDPSIDPDAPVAEGERRPDPRIEAYQPRQDIGLLLSCFDADEMDRRRDAADAGEPIEDPQDPCTYEVAWFPVEEEIDEDTEPTSTEMVLPASVARTSAGWRVRVIANDGEEDGEPVEGVIYPEE